MDKYFVPHKIYSVKDGDNLESIAKEAGITWQELARFNFGTDDPYKINYYLRTVVGSKKPKGSKYYKLSSDDIPGILYVPDKNFNNSFPTQQVNVIQVKIPETDYSKCKVEIHATLLNKILGYYHLYIVTTDKIGTEYYFRGGPSSSPSTIPIIDSVTDRVDDTNENLGYGYIITEYGEYLPDTIDYDPLSKVKILAQGQDASNVNDDLIKQLDAINASKTYYNPLGPNSNSTAFTILRQIGIAPSTPDNVWAPGKDINIEVEES